MLTLAELVRIATAAGKPLAEVQVLVRRASFIHDVAYTYWDGDGDLVLEMYNGVPTSPPPPLPKED
jgi:hypothetical protein